MKAIPNKMKLIMILMLGFILLAALLFGVYYLYISSNETYKKYESNLGYLNWFEYSTITHQCTDQEREIGNYIISVAKDVFSFTGAKGEADKDVGALERYYGYQLNRDFDKVNYDVQLITVKANEKSGYLWVKYSVERFNTEGDTVHGSWNVICKWNIEKTNGIWHVVEVKEPA